MLLHGVENPGFVRHDNTLARPYISYGASDRVEIVVTNPPFGGREEDGIETNFPAHFRTRETADLFLALIIRLLKPGGRAAVVLPDGSLFGEGVKTRLKEHLLEECNLHTIVRLPNSVFKPYASIGTNLLFFEKGDPTKEIWFYEHRVPDGQKAYSMTKPIRVEHLDPCVKWWGGTKRRGRKETEVAWKVTADQVKARGYNLDFKNPHTIADNHGDPDELLASLDEAEQQAGTLIADIERKQPIFLRASLHFRAVARGPDWGSPKRDLRVASAALRDRSGQGTGRRRRPRRRDAVPGRAHRAVAGLDPVAGERCPGVRHRGTDRGRSGPDQLASKAERWRSGRLRQPVEVVAVRLAAAVEAPDDRPLPRKLERSGGDVRHRRDVYDAVGGWDRGRVAWGSDPSLSLRMWCLGFPIVHVPQARIAHLFRKRFEQYRPRWWQILANRWRMLTSLAATVRTRIRKPR